MENQSPILQDIRVASPCHASWKAMEGDDRKRFCSDCRLNVYNFSQMTSAEIVTLLKASEGRVCGRFYRRSDGTMLTADCPRGTRAMARKRSAWIGLGLGMVAAVCGAAMRPLDPEARALRSERIEGWTDSLRNVPVIGIAVDKLYPRRMVMGAIASPMPSGPPTSGPPPSTKP